MLHGAYLSIIHNTSHLDWAWPYPIDRTQLIKPSNRVLSEEITKLAWPQIPTRTSQRVTVNDHNLTSWRGSKKLAKPLPRSAQTTYWYLQKTCTIFPDAKIRAVVLGSRIRMITAAKRCQPTPRFRLQRSQLDGKAIDKGGRSKTCDPCADGNN